MKRQLLLSIDDDPAIRKLVGGLAERAGFDWIEAGDPGTIDQALDRQPDVIVLDLTMPGMDGNEVLWALKQRSSQAAIIISSGFVDVCVQTAVLYAVKAGLNYAGRLDKPYAPGELLALFANIGLCHGNRENQHVQP